MSPRTLLRALAALAALGAPALAQQPDDAGTGLLERSNLLGGLGGARSRWEGRGLRFDASETSEAFGNPTGGRRRAAVYEGLFRIAALLDTGKAFGLPGGTFNVTGFQVHGRGLSANALGGNLMVASSIEANRGALLGELWYEQDMLGGKLTVRAGQLLADTEFITSRYSSLFINSTFGFPTYTEVNLPGGGPAYPFGALSVRLAGEPAESWKLRAAVFNGNPSGPARADGRPSNPSGTAFRLGDGVFAIGEAQYLLNAGEGAAGLPGTYKLGAWYHTGRSGDSRRNAVGSLLNDPLGGLQVLDRRDNWSVYAVADQLLWRKPGTKDQGLGAFTRIMGGPGDRNLLNFYVDAGVTYKGLLPGREDDTLGLAVAYARVSDQVVKVNGNPTLAGSPRLVRRGEAVLELTYQAQVAPRWQVQPVAQHVFHPIGQVPNRPGRGLPSALLLGVRTNVTF